MNGKWYDLSSLIREFQYAAGKAGSKYIRDVSEKSIISWMRLDLFLCSDKNAEGFWKNTLVSKKLKERKNMDTKKKHRKEVKV